MKNYVAADLTRIFKRIPRMVLMLLSFGVYCLAVFIYYSINKIFSDPAAAEYGLQILYDPDIVFTAVINIVGYAACAFGLFELIHVFSDDFKAKTAQIAIGVGVSRAKVVFSKIMEVVILLAIDTVILLGLGVAMSAILGDMMTGAQIAEYARTLFMTMMVSNIAYISLVSILLFSTQSMTLSILAFLALKFNLVSLVIGLTDYVKALEPLNLTNYTLTNMLGKVTGMLNGEAFRIVPVLAVAAYIAASIALTSVIYRKRELEF